ncbi:MAG: PilZ domain-containing protein [Candidatus Acidiferrum sp.]|jgi:glycine cleavage system aminomethyltransferase T
MLDKKVVVAASGSRPATQRQPTAEERRRAQRVMLRMPVTVHIAGKTSLAGFTQTVSQNGAMIIVPEPLAEGAKISIENTKTQNKVDARVVRPPQITSEGSLIPVEFLSPSPQFWNVFFPPTVN